MEAIRAGIRPAMNVRNTLIKIKPIAPKTGKLAKPEIPVKEIKIKLIGIVNNKVIKIPNTPLVKPIIKLSLVNTRLISRFDAPILLRTPISLVLSITEMYVIIPIIIELTTSETETNAIST